MPGMDFREAQRLLARLGAVIGAAEAHGCLCGALCARDDYAAIDWIDELVAGEPEVVLAGSAGMALDELYAATRAALSGRDPGFAPLLPDDTAVLPERVGALADWCTGFLHGLGTAGAAAAPKTGGDVAEIVGDFAEIARAGTEPGEAGEAGEQAWVELCEFVRAGAQLAYEELAGRRAVPPAAGDGPH